MDSGTYWATVHRVAKNQTHLKQLSTKHQWSSKLAGAGEVPRQVGRMQEFDEGSVCSGGLYHSCR